MALSDAWESVAPYAEKLAVWQGYERELQTLLIYGAGVALYTALVFTFYQALSKRHVLLGERRPGFWSGLRWLGAKTFVLPILGFLFFSVIALALFVLVKGDPGVEMDVLKESTTQLLLLAMAIVVSVRVTAYVSETMSNDLAKLVPLSLLAVVLVDPGYLTLEMSWLRLGAVLQLGGLLLRAFLLLVALEAALGLVHMIVSRAGGRVVHRADRAPRKKDLLRAAEHGRVEEPTRSVPVQESKTAREGPAATDFEVVGKG
ncbi:MAG TPA: hypothetical protein VHH36_05115 [Candidatus Thermoplasmatota archaeon]|nr:hypothetical protein [Candidatus Thermoplasmatota archaeon]